MENNSTNIRIKKSELESFIYILICILSLGTIYISRIIISTAIRKAIQTK